MPIRVLIPVHLRTLAGVTGVVELDLPPPVTLRSILDALEARYPVLRGTIRDTTKDRRRPLVRFFASEQDLSHEPLDTRVPESVARGHEPFMIIGSMAGG